MAEAAIQAFRGIDILVNNAGTYPAKGWFVESAEDWNDVYNLDSQGTGLLLGKDPRDLDCDGIITVLDARITICHLTVHRHW